MLPPLRQAATPTGTIEYRESGRRDAPGLVLLHGLGSSAASFRAQYGPLGERFRVVAWNAPGYCGSTPLESDEPSSTGYTDALRSLLDTLEIDQTYLVGSSWGSLIATAFASHYPARARALVLSAPNTGAGNLSPTEQRKQYFELTVPLHLFGPVEMAMFPGCGHLLELEAPERFNAAVLDFFAQY